MRRRTGVADQMRYGTIVADPPWEYPQGVPVGPSGALRGGQPLPYASMSIDQIEGLPVSALAAADCRLWLWTTNTRLHDAFHVAEAWGFTYKQTLVWHKLGTNILGSVAPNSAEYLLVCVRGKPARLATLPSNVIAVTVRGHSQKPECFLDYIELVSPGPYLEMFARRNRLGWDTWGNEAFEHVSVG